MPLKETMRKGFEKAARINEDPKPQKEFHALPTTYPAGAHQSSITGGVDDMFNNASDNRGQTETGKSVLGNSSSKP
ncbi:hypothetical protein QBC35DRAFT_231699 [Podospora australis]|uniref:Uncharacterized protein n=1 Tax=Podospora australis TaxID=1536484 RepID=A0AAN7AIT1_9PEZI|nr:hypothetical protein QBC35DRAFT_231699 [Podospora australis]